MKGFNRIVPVLLMMLILLLLQLVPVAAAEGTESVAPWIGSTEQEPHDCLQVEQNMTDKSATGGWYAVLNNATFSNKMTVSGNVNLILRDYRTLTANDGIYVPQGSKLTIWPERDFKANLIAKSNTEGAGIGGKDNEVGGEIVIYGGTIKAWGADDAAGIGGGSGKEAGITGITIHGGQLIEAHGVGGGAGIGGGNSNDHVGLIEINKGRISASGGNKSSGTAFTDGGAGIGGGADHGPSNIVINGGSITATGGICAAGIGGGDEGGGGEITINGGTISAKGGNGGAGIGGGENESCGKVTINYGSEITANGESGGAGIGSGKNGDFTGEVNISGSVVHAFGDEAAGIGAGYAGNGTEGRVTISGGRIEAWGFTDAAGIGGGAENIWGTGGAGTNVTITGGYIDARAMGSNSDGSAIGQGDGDSEMGSLTIKGELQVQATNDISEYERIFTKAERENACQYRRFALISNCGHSAPATYINVTEDTHQQADCPYCGKQYAVENHSFNISTGVCSVCSYQGRTVEIDFRPKGPNSAPCNVYDQMNKVSAMPGQPYTLPDPEFEATPQASEPHKILFTGWSGEGLTPVDPDDENEKKIYPAGTRVIIPETAQEEYAIYAEWEIAPHDLNDVPAKAATCDQDGYIAHWRCNSCRKFFKDKKGKTEISQADTVIKALGHNWSEVTYEWAEDYSKVTAQRTCRRDSSHIQKETENTTRSVTKEAKCEAWGETTYTASFTNEDFPKAEKTLENVEPTGHTWGQWGIDKAPTEDTAGQESRKCNNCEAVDQRVIPPLEHTTHDMVEVPGKEATCEKKGNKAYWQCSKCKAMYKDEAAAEQTSEKEVMLLPTGHTPGTQEKINESQATCSAVGGYTLQTRCSKCNAVLQPVEHVTVPFDPDAHNWGPWIVTTPATDEDDGEETRTCRWDSSHTETRVIPSGTPSGGGASGLTEDEKAADDVAALIKVLPEEINLDDEEAVKKAEDAYNALTDKQKALVDTALVEKLNKASAAISDWKDYEEASAKAGEAQFNNFKVKARKHKKAKVTILSQGADQTLQLRYSKNKKFKDKTTKLVTLKAGTKKVKIKKLKPRKKYFFQIRPLTEVTNKATGETTQITGQWSKTKKIKARK